MKKTAEDYLIDLDDADRRILDSYCTLSECLGAYLGGGYELVVHSLGRGDRFVLKLVNGGLSGRAESETMDSASLIPLEQLSACVKHGDPPITSCFGNGRNGGLFKSASIGIMGGDRLIGMLCLNFSLDIPFSQIIESFAVPGFLAANSSRSPLSAEPQSYDAYLYDAISNVKQLVTDDPDIPPKYKNKEMIRRLNEAGVFKLKNGVAICAELLGVTITTIYMHIRNLADKKS